MTGRARDALTDFALTVGGLAAIADGGFGYYAPQWREVAIGACLLYLGVLFPVRALMSPGAACHPDGSGALLGADPRQGAATQPAAARPHSGLRQAPNVGAQR